MMTPIMRGSSYAWFITQSRWSKNYIAHKFRVQPPSFISPKIWIHRQLIELQTLTYIIYGPVVNATFLLNRLWSDNYVNYIAQLHNFLDQHNFNELLWIIARLIYYRSCSNILLFFYPLWKLPWFCKSVITITVVFDLVSLNYSWVWVKV